MEHTLDTISLPEGTLPRLFEERCRRTPDAPAYREYDDGLWHTCTWRMVQQDVARWRVALASEGLAGGDRIAILLPNCVAWACCDLAAQSLGLVVVPLYPSDNAANIAYILRDCGAKLLLLANADVWRTLRPERVSLPALATVVSLAKLPAADDPILREAAAWLPTTVPPAMATHDAQAGDLATIVYTSGTTGRPKGVMLSHRNILSNIGATLQRIDIYADDLFLSFLPLSHTLERTCGYYAPIAAGSCVAFARSVPDLPEDLVHVRPTVLVSVPRVYERIYAKLQQGLEERGAPARALFERAEEVGWRQFEAGQHRGPAPGPVERLLWPALRHFVAEKLQDRLGGRLRIAVSGGAPVSARLMHCFLGLGVPILQGYGLTETSPIVSANTPDDNLPESVGRPIPGVEVRLGASSELLVRGPNVMLGYWNAPAKTREAIDSEGWLHTGDIGRLDAAGHLYIAGRLKEILVTSTGEKVAPADLEMSIVEDPLFEQAMVIGEGRPYIAALVVLSAQGWAALADELGIAASGADSLRAEAAKSEALRRIGRRTGNFPSYARVRNVWLTKEPWTVANGLLTPTLKLRRHLIEERFAHEIEDLYAGHRATA